MKKFMAIVMCLVMALSMMTVVSFAADATITIGTVEANPGDVVEVPVYFKSTVPTSQAAVMLNAATGLTCQGIAIDPSVPVSAVANTNLGMLMINAGFATTQATYDGILGTYTFKVADNASGEIALTTKTVIVKNGSATVACDVVAGKVIVKSSEPTVEATKVDAADEDGQPVALYILQPKNATSYGIKYVGTNEEYKDAKFASLAPASDAMAAVKVVGLDNAFEAYAE